MTGTNVLEKKVSELKTWELYMGFVFLQLLIGLVIALLQGVFDMTGIRGALSEVVRQFGNVAGAQMPQKYFNPIAAEVKEGNIFSVN
jgi:hypothetical protein